MKKSYLRNGVFLASLVLAFALFTGCTAKEPVATATYEPTVEPATENTADVTTSTVTDSTVTDTVSESDLQEVLYIRAKDGDTIVVNDGTKDITVRLIGIDTPESVHPDQSKNTVQGKNASEYTKNLLSNYSTLYLEYDVSNTDKYGRTLAYVWLTPDTSNYSNMLNYKLLEDGWAIAKEYKPNVKYSNVFKSVVH